MPTAQPSSNLNLITDATTTAKPFVKWAGGKTQLLEQFEDLFPKKFNNYVEPMVGGGAVFFHLLGTGRLKSNSFLIDNNTELMNCYHIIQENVEELIAELTRLEEEYNQNPEDFFYEVRKWDRQVGFNQRPAAQRAARTIFLNKTCYNGLYRVNSKGQFNTPFGRYKNPTICDEENLRAVSSILQDTTLLTDDFEHCLDIASTNDFVYFDPPYHPLNKTAKFTSYTKEDFGEDDQIRLRDTFAEIAEKGCQVMLSNSDTEFVRDLFGDFRIHTVYAKRHINSNPNNRGEITEVVVTNY